MLRKTLIAVALTVCAFMLTGGSAWALDCHNVSRATNNPVPAADLPAAPLLSFPAGPGATFNVWLTQGNWYWYTINDNVTNAVLDQSWGFIPPGTVSSAELGTTVPGQNGNFTNGVWDHLLAKASCNPNRQTTNGIQSLCGNGP